MKIFIDTIFNLGTIVAFGVIPSFVGINFQTQSKRNLLYGFLFGSGAIIGMMRPVIVQPGIFFDGRSVLVGLAGFFFGLIPALISVIMTIIIRIYQGGSGSITGSLVVLSSAILGILFNRYHKKDEYEFSLLNLFIFGFLVHVSMLLLMFTLPEGSAVPTLEKIGLPIIIIYPLATVVVGKILSLVMTRNVILESLRESEEKYRTVIDNSNEAIVVAQDGLIKFINKRSIQLMGFSEYEILEKPFPAFIYPEDREFVIENFKKRVAGEMLEPRYPFRILRADQKVLWVEIAATLIEWKGKPATLNFFTDITNRKQVEDALRENEANLKAMVEQSLDGILITDNLGTIITWNSSLESLTGIQKNTAMGSFVWDIIFQMVPQEKKTDQLLDGIKSSMKRILESNMDWAGETRNQEIVSTDGSRKVVQTSTFIIKTEASRKMSAIFHDITKLIATEKDLVKLNAELESRVQERIKELVISNKALEAFSHFVSHDLRAPLRAINGFVQLLESKYKAELGTEGARFVDVIAENSTRMNNLIIGMLAITKVSSSEIKKSQIDMNRMIQTVFLELVKEEDRNKTTLVLDDLAFGFGDPALIRQVWTNILENAIKFTKNKVSPTINISSISESSQITYRIQDNGAGFNKEYSEKLFQIFQRLHPANEFEGTGIGLAIVDQIIRRHGGKVWAEGIEGVGATFYFSLPVATGR